MGEAANTHDHKLCQQTFKSSMSDYDVTPIAGRSVLHVHAHSTVSLGPLHSVQILRYLLMCRRRQKLFCHSLEGMLLLGKDCIVLVIFRF